LTWAIAPDEMSFIRVGRDNPSIVAASVVVESSLAGTTEAVARLGSLGCHGARAGPGKRRGRCDEGLACGPGCRWLITLCGYLGALCARADRHSRAPR
jgi:hypothetical protein